MIRLVLRGLMARKLRTVLTSIAIVLGVAMVAGTFILTDQINAAFDDIFADRQREDRRRRRSARPSSTASRTQLAAAARVRHRQVAPVDGVGARRGPDPGHRPARRQRRDGRVGGRGAGIVVSTSTRRSTRTCPSRATFPRTRARSRSSRTRPTRRTSRSGEPASRSRPDGAAPVTLVGHLQATATSSSIGGATVVAHHLRRRPALVRARGPDSVVFASADDGVSPTQLTAASAPPCRTPTRSRPARRTPRPERRHRRRDHRLPRPPLLAFAGVALFVGAFIIFNTFSITVAQRVREFGMTAHARRHPRPGAAQRDRRGARDRHPRVDHRAAGRHRHRARHTGPLRRGRLRPARDRRSRSSRGTVIVALLIGVVVTLVASIGPALRATRVPPIAAVQEGAALPRGRFSRLTPYLAALFLVAASCSSSTPSSDLGGTAGACCCSRRGAILVFIGVGMLARFIVRPLATAIGRAHRGRRRHDRPPRARQRDPQPGAHRLDRRGPDDRRRPRHVRRDLRRGAEGLVHGRHRPRDPGRPDPQDAQLRPLPRRRRAGDRERPGRRGDRVPALPGDPGQAGRVPGPQHDRPRRGGERLQLRLARRRLRRPLRSSSARTAP